MIQLCEMNAPIASTKKATKKQTYKGLNMELMA